MKSKRNIITVISIFVVLMIGAATMALLSQQAEQKSTTQTIQQPTGAQSAERPTATTTIVYTDDGFTPENYIVAAGDTVAVVNNSSREMEFASNDHPSHMKEPELNMSTLQPGQSGTFTVTKVGTWGFHDHFRAGFGGVLEVNKKK